MRLASLVPVTLAVMLSAGCGARTGEDELLTTDLSADGGGSGGTGGTSGAGGQSAGGTSGVGGGLTTGGASGGGGQNGSCCQPSAGRGCPADPSIASCVCANDSFCCTGAWDDTCVREVEEFGCAICPLGTGGSSTGGSGGQSTGGQGAGGQGMGGTGGVPPAEDCCLTHSNPGCFDQGIQECVCEEDVFCCEAGWDFSCVDRATACGAGCGSTGGTGGQNTGGQGSGGTDTGGSGAVGTGGQGAGGQGTGGQGVGGGNPYCDYFTPGTCESCSCNYCYDPLVACLGDAGCTCILASGCSGVAECMSDDYCGDELSAGGAFTSIGRAYQLVSCETNSGCPCF